MSDDPEERRREEVDCRRLLEELRSAAARPSEGPDAPTDKELLNLIDGLFHTCGDFTVTPFREEFDPLIERLSFTGRNLDATDAPDRKRTWTCFLDGSGVDLGWPLNLGMAQWYEDRGMVSHAIAVYEHLYSELRGRLSDECADSLEGWLMTLLHLCKQQGLYPRARHLCEVLEDYHNDGVVSAEVYAEVILLQRDLKYRELPGTFNEDLRTARDKLTADHRRLFHPRTKELIAEAEVWSTEPWRSLEPGLAPLQLALAVEWEFHNKVYKRHERELLKFPDFNGPSRGQTCGLGQMIFLIRHFGSNVGGMIVLARLRGKEFLATADGWGPLEKMREHRAAIAHVREKPYTPDQCRDFLAVVRDSGWVYKFLEAIQPA
jgi:hypothetical protein